MYTPREARFATRSQIISILKKAREKREEEERRRRWAELSATKIWQDFNILVQIGEKATAEQSEQGPFAKKKYIYLHCFAYSNTVPELS